MHNYLNIKKRISKNDLLKHNIVFFIGTMFISVFNYLYYPVIGRLVSVSDFGEIQAVISLFMQLGIILTAYGYVITNIVSNSNYSTDKRSKDTILTLEKILFMAMIIAMPIFIIGAYFLSNSFQFKSLLSIVLVGFLILLNVPSTTRSYALQGERKMKEVSVGGIIFSLGKLILSVVMIYVITDNIAAAIIGYFLAQSLVVLYFQKKLKGKYVSLKESINVFNIKERIAKQKDLKGYLKYGLYILFVMTGLTLLYSFDTVLARLFFDAHTSGLYSGISSIARIIFFITASVAGVLIASVKLDSSDQENKKVLRNSTIMVLGLGLTVLVAFSLFPEFFVSVLMGSDYAVAAKWLPIVSCVMLLCSINNLLAIYQIALKKYNAIVSVLIGVGVMAIGLSLFHSSVENFVYVLLVANLSVIIMLTGQIFYRRKQNV